MALGAMIGGTAAALFESWFAPVEVMDLIPVKPLAEMESSLTENYRENLTGIYGKIRP